MTPRFIASVMFDRLKDRRRSHTRYDRCAQSFFCAICIATAVIFWLRSINHDPRQVLVAPTTDETMRDIAAAILGGAEAYFGRQDTAIAIVRAVVTVVLYLTLEAPSTAPFLIGAILSGV